MVWQVRNKLGWKHKTKKNSTVANVSLKTMRLNPTASISEHLTIETARDLALNVTEKTAKATHLLRNRWTMA